MALVFEPFKKELEFEFDTPETLMFEAGLDQDILAELFLPEIGAGPTIPLGEATPFTAEELEDFPTATAFENLERIFNVGLLFTPGGWPFVVGSLARQALEGREQPMIPAADAEDLTHLGPGTPETLIAEFGDRSTDRPLFTSIINDLEKLYLLNIGIRGIAGGMKLLETFLAERHNVKAGTVAEFLGKPLGTITESDVRKVTVARNVNKNISAKALLEELKAAGLEEEAERWKQFLIEERATAEPAVEFVQKQAEFKGNPTPTATAKDIAVRGGEVPLPTISRLAEDVVLKWFGELQLAQHRSKLVMEDLQNQIPDKARREVIATAMENPDELFPTLAPAELAVAQEMRGMFDTIFLEAEEAGVISSFWDNYVAHIYRDADKVAQLDSAISNALAARTNFAKARKIATLEEAKALGLKPVEDIAEIWRIYSENVLRTVANKRLIDTFHGMRTKDNVPVIMPLGKAPRGYKQVNAPAFERYLFSGTADDVTFLTRGPVAVHPEIAGLLEDIASPFTPRKRWERRIGQARRVVKRMIMYNPLIHGSNIISNVMTQNFNVFKMIGRGGEMWRTRDPIIEKYLEAGLNLHHDYSSDLKASIFDQIDPKTEVGKAIQSIFRPLGALAEWNDKVLWDTILRGSQLSVMESKVAELMSGRTTVTGSKIAPLNEKDAMIQAAQFANDLFGAVPFIWKSELAAKWLNRIFFAPNWTMSNLRQLTGVFPQIEKFMPKFLRHRFLSAEARERIRRDYAKFFVKGIFQMYLLGNIIQTTMMMSQGQKPHLMYFNEEGHDLDIFTGRYGKDGAPIFVANWFFRTIRDLLGWGREPDKTLRNKSEPLMRTAIEMILGFRFWDKKSIRDGTRHILHPENIKRTLIHGVKSLTPVSLITGEPGRSRTLYESIIPLTGTWVRRGLLINANWFDTMRKDDQLEFLDTISGDEQMLLYKMMTEKRRIGGDVAHKLVKYRLRKEMANEDLDALLDELLQNDEYREFIMKAMKEKRYTNVRAMFDRMLPYILNKENIKPKGGLVFEPFGGDIPSFDPLETMPAGGL